MVCGDTNHGHKPWRLNGIKLMVCGDTNHGVAKEAFGL